LIGSVRPKASAFLVYKRGGAEHVPRTQGNQPFRYFDPSPHVIHLAIRVYVRFSLPLRNVEDLLFERGINICLETMRLWWNRFGPLFAGHPAPAGEPGGRLLALAMTRGRDEREAEG
jgi:hypothetical protein